MKFETCCGLYFLRDEIRQRPNNHVTKLVSFVVRLLVILNFTYANDRMTYEFENVLVYFTCNRNKITARSTRIA